MKIGNKVYCKRNNNECYFVKEVYKDDNNLYVLIDDIWYLYKYNDYLLDIDDFYMFDDYFHTLKYMRRLKLDIIK